MNTKSILTLAIASVAAAAAAAGFEAGKGIANDRACGRNARDVTFAERGNGNDYGWRGWDMAVGATVLPWTVPNRESNVYGLRVNLGWGAYARTYGLDAGAFSNTARDFGGVAVNVCGNATGGTMGGVQIGAVNIVRGRAYGLQIAVVNFAEDLHGVQIGALNFNRSGMACLPIVNAGF